jgi:menaquinone-dependent protoporphyrinogen oxidase
MTDEIDETAALASASGGAGPRVLVVFATKHGSTREVAEAVAAELRSAGARVDLCLASDGVVPGGYDAVLVGGPMIMGWHRDASRYVARHRRGLAALPTAYFITAMSLIEIGDDQVDGVPIVKDPWLTKAPRRPGRLSRKERYATPAHYLGAILGKTRPLRPFSVAFFAGRLDFAKMNLFERLFVTLVVGASPGDWRHWEAIRGWARDLLPRLRQADV